MKKALSAALALASLPACDNSLNGTDTNLYYDASCFDILGEETSWGTEQGAQMALEISEDFELATSDPLTRTELGVLRCALRESIAQQLIAGRCQQNDGGAPNCRFSGVSLGDRLVVEGANGDIATVYSSLESRPDGYMGLAEFDQNLSQSSAVWNRVLASVNENDPQEFFNTLSDLEVPTGVADGADLDLPSLVDDGTYDNAEEAQRSGETVFSATNAEVSYQRP